MEQYEINKTLENLKTILLNLETKINLSEQKKKIVDFNKLIIETSFWDKKEDLIKINKQIHRIQEKINLFSELKKKLYDLIDLFDLSKENPDDFLILVEDLKKLTKDIKDFEIYILLNKEYDKNNAILILHPGAGGTESQDWCEMLFRMYQKYAQRKKFQVKILHLQQGTEAGLKTVSLLIQGEYAYGYLKAERGVHRLVRISPFDSNLRRHTSFVSCEVLPEINEEIKIDIKDEDLRIDVFRSSGAGGQHVNTTDSAVRITHLATNIVVNCQNERSQIKNREKAIQILKTKLLELAVSKKKENEKNFKDEQKNISWSNQIRSYVFHPYQMIKDHRTNYEFFQINLVMEGYLDEFIYAFLKQENVL
ncbi:MAG: peptide chain release factor 2 [Candidatus Phytoplasma stylosanthis]|uniref:peptide chain release factor 2 n=1 Tax=Candidatus Phytoplasma stylosanthis TaxID=2798314 RepID=UPI00293AD902|nr:peptide chain release factor 2 [Candidatus Phytoplasma stylosanthis]MDV3167967.1 peptide chain release factor 2 [Candidatus Phytoplasma stylosanthis]MDV3170768.1 peptide chain release factor 2 [Candidatus Phytoplasma stylosanthis]MDV3174280.1 peptide chain release factor 2 [Candidatus Phytoplasma stylosanthis]MDV3202743.1 peptide chain release factor 2 [Candidatus Phytoplasma stylosanthis]